ncbi:MAG: hypothetical protein JOZ08_25510 [Verrucomicrobia bacterium]|nr:hypothetical protein [Verrucomicrobiota bacterium]MBV8274831.1 hypothetical protein [Verrucomicrobiota bacterium]
MKTITHFILLAMILVGVSSCASTSVTKIGIATYAPLAEGKDVTIFNTESEVKQPFVVVGIISYEGPGNNDKLDFGAATEPLREKARALGGNGIIIDKFHPINSVITSTRISVRARAIHLI